MGDEEYHLTTLDIFLSMGPLPLLFLVGCLGITVRSLCWPPHPSPTRRTTLALLPIVVAAILTLRLLHSHLGISYAAPNIIMDAADAVKIICWEGRTLLASGLLASLLTFASTTLRLRAASNSSQ